jgi:hypothetical protein
MFSYRLPVTLGRGQFNKILSFFRIFRNFEFLLSAWLLLFDRFQKMFVKERDEIFGLKSCILILIFFCSTFLISTLRNF